MDRGPSRPDNDPPSPSEHPQDAPAADAPSESTDAPQSASNEFMNNINNLLRRTDEYNSAVNSPSGAIIITINYVFSDENNPVNPNRTGSLVMTVPNVSANRDPRLLDEFVRLATQMAYSSIVNGFKDKGITVEKFESFAVKPVDSLAADSTNCSICFEQYQVLAEPSEGVSDDPQPKRRKLNPPEPPAERPKYLSECTKDFPHYPVEMPCGHVFGQSCLAHWLKSHTTCPLCRSSVTDRPEPPESAEDVPVNTDEFGIQNSWNNGASNVRLIGRTGLNEILDRLHQSRPNSSPAEAPEPAPSSEGANDSETTSTRSRDEGVFSNILAYIRRRRQNSEAEPLFPTGVASRRSRDGVETRQIDNTNEILDFLNLRSLTDDAPESSTTDEPQPSNNDTSTSSSHDDNNADHTNEVNNDTDG